jgi:endoglucanase
MEGLRRGSMCSTRKSDFDWMAQRVFNFARLPCSYWGWSNKNLWMTISEVNLEPLDRAIDLGRQYGIHIDKSLNEASISSAF